MSNRTIGLVAASLVLLIASGCGGGGDGASGAQQQPVAAPAVSVDAYGDSTMYGTTFVDGVVTRAAKPVPELLQESLGVTVANRGLPGWSAPLFLTGHAEIKPFSQQLQESSASIVYLNFGINDAGDPDETTAMFHDALVEIIRIAKQSGKAVVLETPNPVGDARYSRLPDFAAVTLQVGREQAVPVIDQFAGMSAMDWRSLMSDPMQAHPTQQGYAVKASIALATLRAEVQALR